MEACKHCGDALNETNWYPSLQRKRQRSCKACSRARSTRWKTENRTAANAIAARARARLRETQPTYSRDWSRLERAQRRMEMLEAYGGCCAKCGIDNPLVLDIDHINDDGAADRRAGLHGWQLYRRLRREGYPRDRFQLLCRNCNWLKEMARRGGIAEIIGRAILSAEGVTA